MTSPGRVPGSTRPRLAITVIDEPSARAVEMRAEVARRSDICRQATDSDGATYAYSCRTGRLTTYEGVWAGRLIRVEYSGEASTARARATARAAALAVRDEAA